MTQTAIQQATIAPAPLAAQAQVENETERMVAAAAEASAFLKALAHEGRLLILCHLSAGERTVSELEDLLGQRQVQRLEDPRPQVLPQWLVRDPADDRGEQDVVRVGVGPA